MYTLKMRRPSRVGLPEGTMMDPLGKKDFATPTMLWMATQPTFRKMLSAGFFEITNQDDKLQTCLDAPETVGHITHADFVAKYKADNSPGAEEIIDISARPEDFKAMTIKQAEPFVKGEEDLEVLKGWYASESRATLKGIIEDRISSLDLPEEEIEDHYSEE